jgi:hypothetical protein
MYVGGGCDDFAEERKVLSEDVFPYLKLLCAQLDTELIISDIHFSGNVHDAAFLSACHAELLRAAKEGPGPHFISLVGEKYGSKLLPRSIGQKEMETMIFTLETMGQNTALLRAWYTLEPTSGMYHLKPLPVSSAMLARKNGLLASEQEWAKVTRSIEDLLAKAASVGIGRSVSMLHQELLWAFSLRVKPLIFKRTLRNLYFDMPATRPIMSLYVDIVQPEEKEGGKKAIQVQVLPPGQSPSQQAQQGQPPHQLHVAQNNARLLSGADLNGTLLKPVMSSKQKAREAADKAREEQAALKAASAITFNSDLGYTLEVLLREAAGKGAEIVNEEVEWAGRIAVAHPVYSRYLMSMSNKICSLLVEKVLTSYGTTKRIRDPLLDEVTRNRDFALGRAEDVNYRSESVSVMLNHLESSVPFPFILYGEPGSGTTSAMSKLVTVVSRSLPSSSALVYRFLGRSMETVTTTKLLRYPDTHTSSTFECKIQISSHMIHTCLFCTKFFFFFFLLSSLIIN